MYNNFYIYIYYLFVYFTAKTFTEFIPKNNSNQQLNEERIKNQRLESEIQKLRNELNTSKQIQKKQKNEINSLKAKIQQLQNENENLKNEIK